MDGSLQGQQFDISYKTTKHNKIARLKSSKQISSIFEKNCKVSTKIGMILWKPLKQKQSLVAYCVSVKHGNSVKRNRIKRVLRELVKINSELIPEHIEFVILPSKFIEKWSVQTLDKDFKLLLQKLKNKNTQQT